MVRWLSTHSAALRARSRYLPTLMATFVVMSVPSVIRADRVDLKSGENRDNVRQGKQEVFPKPKVRRVKIGPVRWGEKIESGKADRKKFGTM